MPVMRYPVSRPWLTGKEQQYLSECLTDLQLSAGPRVEKFEREFANWVGAGYAVACTSGTTALHLALAALGVGPGHEVIVPDVTYVATANAVRYCGATVVLADIDPVTWNIDPEDVLRKVTPRTRAVVPVHLYGAPCDMRRLREVASQRHLAVVEDAAEGLGGSLSGRYLGTFGDAGTFSFYGNKVMTTGEGGMVVTDDRDIAAELRHFRGMCQTKQRYFHDEVGFNYRMTEMQAAIGRAQLERLEENLDRRQRVIDRYRCYPCYDGSVQPFRPNERHAPWLFTFRTTEHDRLAVGLAHRGIETRPLFVPLHRLPMYAAPDAAFPVASALTGLSLPTYPELRPSDVDDIMEVVMDVWTSTR